MYTAIRTYTASDPEEIARRVREEFLPMIRGIRGFMGYYGVDGGDGRLASIKVCEDREGVEESTRIAADWVRERLSP